MLHINRYPVWPDGRRKKQSGFGPLSGTLIEKYDARYALDPASLVSGAIWGVPAFLWKADDGATPTIAQDPATNLVATGAVTAGMPSPYQYPSGVDATVERYYNKTSYRKDTTRLLSPADTDDIVVAMKFMEQKYYGDPSSYIAFSTNPAGAIGGFYIGVSAGYWRMTTIAGGVTRATAGVTYNRQYNMTPNIFIGAVNRDGNIYPFFNGNQASTAVTPAGSMVGRGISIGATYSGASPVGEAFGVEWIAVWFGLDIYENWAADGNRLIKRLSFESMGLRETVTNSKYWSFRFSGGGSGNSGALSYQDHNDRWWFGSKYGFAAGNPKGALVSPYNSTLGGSGYNPSVTTGWTSTGGVKSVVDDSAALATVKAETWGPRVFQFLNDTGVPQVIYRGTDASMASKYKFGVIARYLAGSGALFGWYNPITTTFVSVCPILGDYVPTNIWEQTPPDNDSRFSIQIPDGCTLLFFAHNYSSASGRSNYVVPTGPAEQFSNERQRTILTTEYIPSNASGSYLIETAPSGWSGNECDSDAILLSDATVAVPILQAEATVAGWATSDGVTQIQTAAPYVPVVGVYVSVWTAWKEALQYVQEALNLESLVTGVYDGAKVGAGALTVSASIYGGEYYVRTLEIRDVS